MRAPIPLLALTLLALASLGPVRAVVAQEASPVAAGPLGPNLGDRVRVVDAFRDDIAVVSVTKLADPSSDREAQPGFRIVGVDFAVENVSSDDLYPMYLYSYNFGALDTRGFGYGPIDDHLALGRLDGSNGGDAGFYPGEAVGGTVDFQLPVDAEIAQIVYSPHEDYRVYPDHQRIPVLDLRPDRPTYGDAVPVLDASGTQLATIAVAAPTDPYVLPPGVDGVSRIDERHVAFSATIRNTGRAPIAVDNEHFYVLDSYGFLSREEPREEGVNLVNDSTGPFLQPTDALVPGDAATGLIKFRLAVDADPIAIIYSPAPDRAIIVAEGVGV